QYEFSPDGKRLALTYPDPQTDEEKANEKKKRDWVIYGENLKFTRLYITDGTPGAEVRKIFEQNLHITEFTWSADSKTIVFKATESPETDHTYMFQKIYRVDVADGKPEVVCRTEGKIGHITVSPDGKTLAYCGAVDITDPQSQSLFIVPVTGGTPRNLTEKFEGSVSDMKWLNNTTLMVNSILGCYTLFSKMDIATGSKTSIDTKGLIFRSWDIAPQNGILVLAANSPQHPSELFSGSISKPEFTRLTFSNQELNNIALAKQEVIEWKHPDGLRIEGVLTYPLNYETGKKYPLIFQLHGGPESASLNGWTTRSLYPVQLYAAAGYFVLEPNYRGSIGRGVEFSKGDHKDLAGKEFEDILAGIDFLAGKGMVDASRVGCGGFSYGGYLSAWAATKHSQRFKAAMMGAGISDWISFVNTTDIIYENSLVHWNLWWYDNMQLVWDRSPMAHINNAKTPTLIIHGEKDLRVPISQGEELYYGLKTKGIDVQLVKYKRQGHGISEREGQLDFMKRTLEWFEKYLKE
ncbi:MAG: S9 family peptidase, partial [Bacteroidetes bacterium]|nr:S9 family peptidase [Bacteroidota bacterium]